MAIPAFQEFFKDILLCLTDGELHTVDNIRAFAAEQKKLSKEDLELSLANGCSVFVNRIAWAQKHLKAAGLIEYPRRTIMRITDEGRRVLIENQTIDLDLLKKYKSLRNFQSHCSSGEETIKNSLSPHEQIETAFSQINIQLADEILDELLKLTPALFEKLTLQLLNKMGYGGSGTVTKISGDGGIDVIISEDKLGLRNIYIQAKRYALDSGVGRPEIQGFVGAIANKDGKGVFITTSKFSEPAKQCAKENHIVLIDGERLATLMIEHSVGVSTVQTYDLKRIDSDFFTDLV